VQRTRACPLWARSGHCMRANITCSPTFGFLGSRPHTASYGIGE
jgi:hypothetical protein